MRRMKPSLNSIKILPLVCISLGIGAPLPAICGPGAVEVSARIQINSAIYQDKEGSIRLLRSNSWSFTSRCISSKTRWFIESHHARNSTLFYYFDGTNTYEKLKWAKSDEPETHLDTSEAHTGEPHFVKVIPSSHPQDDIGLNVPWLAFCSPVYLDQPGRLIPIPGPELIRRSPYAFGYTDKTLRFEDELGLPRSIELRTSVPLLQQSLRRQLLIRDHRTPVVSDDTPTPVPFQGDLLQCRYSVLTSTNVGGWNIPLSFRLVIFPQQVADAHNMRIELQVSGTTEHVARVPGVPHFEMEVGENAIIDLRTVDAPRFAGAVRYNFTNSGSITAIPLPTKPN